MLQEIRISLILYEGRYINPAKTTDKNLSIQVMKKQPNATFVQRKGTNLPRERKRNCSGIKGSKAPHSSWYNDSGA